MTQPESAARGFFTGSIEFVKKKRKLDEVMGRVPARMETGRAGLEPAKSMDSTPTVEFERK